MIFTPTKVILVFGLALFLALFCWAASDPRSPIPNPKIKPHEVKDLDENSGTFQKKVGQNGWGLRECVRAGAAGSRTRRSSGHHVLNPQNFE